MKICPDTGRHCPDDLCHGSGCTMMGGYPMLTLCYVCLGLIDDELPEASTCQCDEDPDFDWDEMP